MVARRLATVGEDSDDFLGVVHNLVLQHAYASFSLLDVIVSVLNLFLQSRVVFLKHCCVLHVDGIKLFNAMIQLLLNSFHVIEDFRKVSASLAGFVEVMVLFIHLLLQVLDGSDESLVSVLAFV